MKVELPETPSSGYIWNVAENPSISYTERYKTEERYGRGSHIFIFRTKNPEPQKIRLELNRSWLDTPPVDVVEYEI